MFGVTETMTKISNDILSIFDPHLYRQLNMDISIPEGYELDHLLEMGVHEGRWFNKSTNMAQLYFLANRVEMSKNDFLIFFLSQADLYNDSRSDLDSHSILSESDLDLLMAAGRAFLKRVQLPFENECNPDCVGALNWMLFVINAGKDYKGVLPLQGDFHDQELDQSSLSLALKAAEISSRIEHATLEQAFADVVRIIRDSSQGSVSDIIEQGSHHLFVISIIEPYFSTRFYVRVNSDLELCEHDALQHYMSEGWKKDLDPTPDFCVSEYKRMYPDVSNAGIDPFFHFHSQGKYEGRVATSVLNKNNSVASQINVKRSRGYIAETVRPPIIGFDDLRTIIISLVREHSNIVLSFSHDIYFRNTGGVQAVIGDESASFQKKKYLYIHFSPVEPRLYFLARSQSDIVSMSINDQVYGHVSLRILFEVFSTSTPRSNFVCVVHSLLGLSPEIVSDVIQAVKPRETYVWAHDYSLICENFNLLRNNIVYCNAPSVESMSCVVCIYGPDRGQHLDRIKYLDKTLNPIYVFPSEVALSIIKRAKILNIDKAVVIPHMKLDFIYLQRYSLISVGTGFNPMRIAFIGYDNFVKGYSIWNTVVYSFFEDLRYKFYRYVDPSAVVSDKLSLKRPIRVSAKNRNSMIDALISDCIDVVVIPALWPETFSLATYEGIASGCLIVTVASSGNVSEISRSLSRGVVFDSELQLLQAFADGSIIRRRRQDFSDRRSRAAVTYESGVASLY